MRPVDHGDIAAAARAVAGLAPADRTRALARMFAAAHVADIYRKRTGRAHRLWGNGTLYAAAIPPLSPLPRAVDLSDVTYVQALGAVLEGLIAWRTREGTSARRGKGAA